MCLAMQELWLLVSAVTLNAINCRHFLIYDNCWHFNIYEHDFLCSVELSMKKVLLFRGQSRLLRRFLYSDRVYRNQVLFSVFYGRHGGTFKLLVNFDYLFLVILL